MESEILITDTDYWYTLQPPQNILYMILQTVHN